MCLSLWLGFVSAFEALGMGVLYLGAASALSLTLPIGYWRYVSHYIFNLQSS